MKKHGFTLIELLVVVAIIGILATIAISNLLQANIRAKIAQTQANMKTLDTIIKQFQLDKGVMLVDINDGRFQWGIERIQEKFHNVGAGEVPPRNMSSVFAPLTSPVSYLTENGIYDPFVYEFIYRNDQQLVAENDNDMAINTYIYVDNDPADTNDDDALFVNLYRSFNHTNPIQLKKGDYIFYGMGPGYQKIVSGNNVVYGYQTIPYRITNGIISTGLFIRHSSEGLIN